MRVYNNEPFIRRRALIGKWGSLGGLGILFLGLLISFYERYFYISFACLIVGFLLSQMGTYNAARFTRSPSQHERLERALKGLDDRYVLFNYMLPAAHVLLGPHGLMVFRLKDQPGEIECHGNRWKQKKTALRVLSIFGPEGLGNPTQDVEDEFRMLVRFLEKRGIPLDGVPVEKVVLFLSPAVKLTVEEPTVTVLTAKQLKPYLREPARRKQFRATERKAFQARLEAALGLAPAPPAEEAAEEEGEA
jgi:hypothetical protein